MITKLSNSIYSIDKFCTPKGHYPLISTVTGAIRTLAAIISAIAATVLLALYKGSSIYYTAAKVSIKKNEQQEKINEAAKLLVLSAQQLKRGCIELIPVIGSLITVNIDQKIQLEKEKLALHNQCITLNQKLEKLENGISQKKIPDQLENESIENLVSQIEKIKKEKLDLHTKCENLDKALKVESERKGEIFRDGVTQRKNLSDHYEGEIKELEEEIRQQKRTFEEEKREKIEELVSKIEKIEKEKLALHNQCITLNQKLEKLENGISQKKIPDKLEKESIENLVSQIEKIKKEKLDLHTKCENLDKALKVESERKGEIFRDGVTQRKNLSDHYEGEIKELEEEIRQQKRTFEEEKREKIEELESNKKEIERLNAIISEQTVTINIKEKKIKKKSRTNALLRREIDCIRPLTNLSPILKKQKDISKNVNNIEVEAPNSSLDSPNKKNSNKADNSNEPKKIVNKFTKYVSPLPKKNRDVPPKRQFDGIKNKNNPNDTKKKSNPIPLAEAFSDVSEQTKY